jgi:hypothetical protein
MLTLVFHDPEIVEHTGAREVRGAETAEAADHSCGIVFSQGHSSETEILTFVW